MSYNNNNIIMVGTSDSNLKKKKRNDSVQENSNIKLGEMDKEIENLMEEVTSNFKTKFSYRAKESMKEMDLVSSISANKDRELELLTKISSLENKLKVKEQEISYLKSKITSEVNLEKNKGITMRILDKERRMPSINMVTEDSFEELIMETEASRDTANCMMRDYLVKNSFLIDNLLTSIQSMSLKSPVSTKMLMGTMIHNKKDPLKCMCKLCFESKLTRIGNSSTMTVIDLALISDSDIKIEFDSSTYRAVFKEPKIRTEDWNPMIEIESVKFSRTPIRIFPGKELRNRLTKSRRSEMFCAELNILSMEMTISSPLRIMFFVKQARDWVEVIEQMNLSFESSNSSFVMESDDTCFLRFLKSAFSNEVNVEKMTKSRIITSMNDLTLLEEVALQTSLMKRPVFIKYDPFSSFNKTNHISLKPFKGSEEVFAYSLSDPLLRKINFFSDDIQDLSLEEMEDEFDLMTDETADECDQFVKLRESEGEDENAMEDMENMTSKEKEIEMVSGSNVNNVIKNMKDRAETKDRMMKEFPSMEEVFSESEATELNKIVEEHNNKMISNMMKEINKPMSNDAAFSGIEFNKAKMMMFNPLPAISSQVSRILLMHHTPYKMSVEISKCQTSYELIKLDKENYPIKYINLVSFTFKEFLLISFFWSDLMDFSLTITMKDLSMLGRAREDLPSYMNYMLRRGILMDVDSVDMETKMNKLFEILKDSHFYKMNRTILDAMYMMLAMRVQMSLTGISKSQEFMINNSVSSYRMVEENNLVNLNVVGNRNFWYEMYRNRMNKASLKFINASSIPLKDKINMDKSEDYMSKMVKEYRLGCEREMVKGMITLMALMSVWWRSI